MGNSMGKFLMMALGCVTAVACAKKGKLEPDFESWKRATVTQKTIDSKTVNTVYVVDCRKVGEPKAVHYYYSVVADPSTKKIKTTEQTTAQEITFANAQFIIEYYGMTPKGTLAIDKTLLSTDVDLTITINEKNEQTISIVANKNTLSRVQAAYPNNPYVAGIKEGEEMMTVKDIAGIKVNVTKMDLPGISENESLECK